LWPQAFFVESPYPRELMRTSSREGGFTLVEIMIVVAIIGLIMSIAIPNFVKTRESARVKICIENMVQIETAKQTWALESGKTTGDTPNDDEVYGYMKHRPKCPAGFDYQPNAIGTDAKCLSGLDKHVQ
jgi:prepilin-type N-terminal cleavage/methylation domain-containing protein